MLPAKDRMTIAMKKAMEMYWRGFLRKSATFGRYRAVRMPAASGMPSRMKMVRNTSISGMVRVGMSAWTAAKCR